MRVGIIGSRSLAIPDLGRYLPPDVTEIVSGGARGVDSSARAYALAHAIPLREFLPEYDRYGRSAPLKRNDQIVAASDLVIAFWDGVSKGTAYTIRQCRKMNVPCKVFVLRPGRCAGEPGAGPR